MATKHIKQPQPATTPTHKKPHDITSPTTAHQASAPAHTPSNVQSPRASDILALQRQVGNGAVLALLAQRKIQAKLTVGPADDSYEQEADRVASQVLTMTAPGPASVQREGDEEELQTSRIAPIAQRQAEEDDEEVQAKSIDPRAGFEAGSEVESQLRAQQGGGNPLPGDVRAFMEPRFGADFAGVRVHVGGEAARLNRQIHAVAFTHGQDIFMGEDKYAPGTDAGKHLLAHELTHVVQQTGGAQRAERATLTRKAINISSAQSIKNVQRLGRLHQEGDLRSVAKPGFKWKGQSSYADILDLVAGYHRLEEDHFHARLEQLVRIQKGILKWEQKHGEAIESTSKWANFLPNLKRKKVVSDLKFSLNEEVRNVTQKLREKRKRDKENERLAVENERKARLMERWAKEDSQEEKYFESLSRLDPAIFTDPKTISEHDGEKPNVLSKGEGAGELSQVYKVTHKFGVKTRAGLSKRIPGGKFVGYFKHQLEMDPNVTEKGSHKGTATGIPVNNPRFMERSLAMYEMDKLLGANVIAPTYASSLKGKPGYIQEGIKGKQGSSVNLDFLDDAEVSRGLSNLYLLDIICNQVDRHSGNFFLTLRDEEYTGVKGIDNDLSFGEKNPDQIGGQRLGAFAIYLPFAQKIVELAEKPELVQKALFNLLTEGEISATINRLQALAMRLKVILEKHKGKTLVEKFDI